MLKSFGWGLLPTVGLIVVIGVAQALLFAVVLPRVKGITFALVTLGFASVFHIVVMSNELVITSGATFSSISNRISSSSGRIRGHSNFSIKAHDATGTTMSKPLST